MDRLTKSFPVFDCDAHINDPEQIWDYVPESQKELVRNTYWRGDARGLAQRRHAGHGWRQRRTSPGYNPICIAGPQMNKKIMRKLNTMPLTDGAEGVRAPRRRASTRTRRIARWT